MALKRLLNENEVGDVYQSQSVRLGWNRDAIHDEYGHKEGAIYKVTDLVVA
jgi:hypothetical protein